jgi:hypothetical protein
LLGDATVRSQYAELAAAYPLDQAVLATYIGPGTSRARHPLMASPASLVNGLRELIVRLAAT